MREKVKLEIIPTLMISYEIDHANHVNFKSFIYNNNNDV